MLERAGDLLGRHRAGEVEALGQPAAQPAQLADVVDGLDPLGHHVERQRPGHRDDRLGDRGVARLRAEPVDERAVDLEHVERQAGQVAERRVAGAEVVEHQPNARAPSKPGAPRPSPSASRTITVSVISRLRQAGSRPVLRRTEPTTSGSERRVTWTADRLTDIVSGAASGRARYHCAAWRQACSSTHRPIGSIRPFSSAIGMNSAGRDLAPLGVAPAQQRLDADDREVAQRDHRLVLEAQLVRARAPGAGRSRPAGARSRARASPRRTPRSGRARAPWPGTSRRRRRGSARRPARRRGPARCRCWWSRSARSPTARTAGRRSPRSARRVSIASRSEAMSSSRIPNSSPPNRATVSLERSACFSRGAAAAQQLVAHVVAEAVVDQLEVVEIEEQDRGTATAGGPRRASACSRRSTNRTRLGRPVSGSCTRPVADGVLDRLALERVGQHVGQRLEEVDVAGGERCAGAIDWTTSTPNGSRERPSILTDSPAPVRRPPKSGCSKRVSASQSSTTTGAPLSSV